MCRRSVWDLRRGRGHPAILNDAMREQASPHTKLAFRRSTPRQVVVRGARRQAVDLMFSGGLCMSINESGVGERSGIDASKAMTAAPAFFRIADVMRITALSRATLYRRIADGKFPSPVHLGGRACGWTPAALQAWIADPGGYQVPGLPAGQPAGAKSQPPEMRANAGRSQRQGSNQASARIASSRMPNLHQASRFSSA